MSERITIILDHKLQLSLRNLQSAVIKKYGKNCSFSAVISIAAKYGVKNITPELIHEELEKE